MPCPARNREPAKPARNFVLLDRAIARVLPAVPKPLVRALASPYIAGPSLEDAVACARRLNGEGKLATILGTSTRTVQKHLQNVYAKLGVENRTAAAMRVRRG